MGKVIYKTNEEIELIRLSSLLVGKTLAEVAKLIKPGVTTLQLDKVAEEFCVNNGVQKEERASPRRCIVFTRRIEG